MLSVRPDSLRSSAPGLSTAGLRLTQALTRLQSSLDALGAPWGNDEPGLTVGAQCAANRRLIEPALGRCADAVHGVAEFVTVAADNQVGSDHASGQQVAAAQA
jgi:hypothetical protein